MGCDPGEAPGIYRDVIPNFFYRAMSGQALPIAGGGAETGLLSSIGKASGL
jgi:hypothetical protein